MIQNWNYPTSIVAGAGAVARLVEMCRALDISRPLLVTDKGIMSLDFYAPLADALNAAFSGFGVFSDVDPNPNGANVENGLAAYTREQHDGVIALGGGSALDAAKAIALMVGQTHTLWDFEDVGDNWTRVNEESVPPIIAIPTTAGTGSEVGRASVITDQDKGVKKIIFHPKMLPSKVILDPELCFALPKKLTAATGLDALSHCLEAYCAPGYHPMADGIALEGMRLIKENLVKACENPKCEESRLNMLVASSMGATAFQKGLGAMHALAHSLGAQFGTHHGLLNAILMPYVLEANRIVLEDKIARLAVYLELDNASFDGFMKWVIDIRHTLAIPDVLSEVIEESIDFEKIAKLAVEDPSAGGNPIQFTVNQYADLCEKAFNG